jgi:hypothetical protein
MKRINISVEMFNMLIPKQINSNIYPTQIFIGASNPTSRHTIDDERLRSPGPTAWPSAYIDKGQ